MIYTQTRVGLVSTHDHIGRHDLLMIYCTVVPQSGAGMNYLTRTNSKLACQISLRSLELVVCSFYHHSSHRTAGIRSKECFSVTNYSKIWQRAQSGNSKEWDWAESEELSFTGQICRARSCRYAHIKIFNNGPWPLTQNLLWIYWNSIARALRVACLAPKLQSVWPAKCLQLRTEDTSVNSVVMLPATLTKQCLHPLRTPRQLCAIAAMTLQRHRSTIEDNWMRHRLCTGSEVWTRDFHSWKLARQLAEHPPSQTPRRDARDETAIRIVPRWFVWRQSAKHKHVSAWTTTVRVRTS